MASQPTIDARESVESRYALHYALLSDRVRLSSGLKATMVARFGHFAVLFGFFFLAIIAPSTLAGVQLFDYKALFAPDPAGLLPVAKPGTILLSLIALVDYTGRLLVRGLRHSLFRQLHIGTETADDWRDHLAQSARRLHITFLVEWLTLLATLVGLAFLIVPGLYVLYIAGPVSHYVIAREQPLVAGIKHGIAFAHRHRSRLLPRFLFKIGWRFLVLLALAGGLVAIYLFASMYLPLVTLLVGVAFLAARPFILHVGLVREVAYASTLQRLEGDLELAAQ